MAGDTLRAAFRTELNTVISGASPAITWVQRDLENTTDEPDASTGFFMLEFPGGSESQFSFGAPGHNWHDERGQVTVRVCAPLGRDRNLAETYAEQVRAGFRMRRFTTSDSREVRILATAPLGGGQTEGGLWAEAIALGYRVFNVG